MRPTEPSLPGGIPGPGSAGEDRGLTQGGGFRAGRAQSRPRPLTEDESAQLHMALAAVLRDIQATGAIVPDIHAEAHEDPGEETIAAWVENRAGSGGMGIRVSLRPPLADQLVQAAEQLQEWELEELASAGRPATWPECPDHPNSHPLSPEVRESAALWCCPATGHPAGLIGGLRPV